MDLSRINFYGVKNNFTQCKCPLSRYSSQSGRFSFNYSFIVFFPKLAPENTLVPSVTDLLLSIPSFALITLSVNSKETFQETHFRQLKFIIYWHYNT